MKTEHYQFIQNAISDFDTEYAYNYYVKSGYSDMRYRWDLLYKSGLSKWICDNLYSYLNDAHIDTALKSITGRYLIIFLIWNCLISC